jgi:hypothetical protein
MFLPSENFRHLQMDHGRYTSRVSSDTVPSQPKLQTPSDGSRTIHKPCFFRYCSFPAKTTDTFRWITDAIQAVFLQILFLPSENYRHLQMDHGRYTSRVSSYTNWWRSTAGFRPLTPPPPGSNDKANCAALHFHES